MPRSETIYCPRCDEQVRPLRPWPGWRVAWIVWRVAVVCLIPLTPIILADFCVSLPSTFLFLLAGGAIRGYARAPSVCTVCSLEIDEIVDGGTSVRVRPYARGAPPGDPSPPPAGATG